jgi:hypothetical protein
MHDIDVVGGGLAGLIAAAECAEAGATVRVLEARSRLGGRASSTPGPYVANLGPHALYAGGALWDWLERRDLHRPYRRPRSPAIWFQWQGQIRRLPPVELMRAVRHSRARAPVDRDLHSWLGDRAGEGAARAASGFAGPLTFDHDPGRLSAAFVWHRIRRILLKLPSPARYVVDGWSALVDRLVAHNRALGVVLETNSRIGGLGELDGRPTILALEPGAARRLLGDESLRPETPSVALLDVALTSRRGDPYIVFDLDGAAFVDRFTATVPTLAPNGEQLVQASVGLAPDEDLEGGVTRIEAVLDGAFAGWRDRAVWRRQAIVRESTGAVDVVGRTWRDRIPVTYADRVWLAGDWVAAPGHLSEVSCASATVAATAAVAAARPALKSAR